MIVEESSSSSAVLHRFLDVRFLPHPSSCFVVNAGLVDSSKYSCIKYEGVIGLLTQPTTFRAVYVHVPLLFGVLGNQERFLLQILGANGEDLGESLFVQPLLMIE
jgi:hypothetical protein